MGDDLNPDVDYHLRKDEDIRGRELRIEKSFYGNWWEAEK
jgi:hypothetical protein